MEELHQDQQPPHHQPLLHHHHLQMVVDPHNGPLINGVMMKTTMPIATMTVELVALMKPKDGIITAQIVSALSVNQLDGMGTTTVMTSSILKIVNMTEEIAAVIACLLPTATIANALIKEVNGMATTNLKKNVYKFLVLA